MNIAPMLLDIPETIDTERLMLRNYMSGDGAMHFEAVEESIEDLRRYIGHIPWVKEEPSLLHSEALCLEYRSRFLTREELRFNIVLKSGNKLVGNIALLRIDWTVPKFEIGYWCLLSAQGNGYVGEAVQAITQFAFEGLAAERVEIRTDDENVASWKVAERAGFTLEGVLRNYERANGVGELRDSRLYARVANRKNDQLNVLI